MWYIHFGAFRSICEWVLLDRFNLIATEDFGQEMFLFVDSEHWYFTNINSISVSYDL